MKKNGLLITLVLWAFKANADIAVDWTSDSWFSPVGVYPDIAGGQNPTDNPTLFIPQDAYHVLIWSLSAPLSGAYAQPGSGLGAGEVVIWDSTKAMRGGDVREGGGFFDYYLGGAIVFTDAQAPGGDASAGFVYSRIFSSSTVTGGDWYYQSQAYATPVLPLYTEEAPSKVTHITSDWGTYGDRTMGDGGGMYQVIPEPATMTLSLAAIGAMMYRLRRKRNQQAA